jgi:hypothetical protein
LPCTGKGLATNGASFAVNACGAGEASWASRAAASVVDTNHFRSGIRRGSFLPQAFTPAPRPFRYADIFGLVLDALRSSRELDGPARDRDGVCWDVELGASTSIDTEASTMLRPGVLSSVLSEESTTISPNWGETVKCVSDNSRRIPSRTASTVINPPVRPTPAEQ